MLPELHQEQAEQLLRVNGGGSMPPGDGERSPRARKAGPRQTEVQPLRGDGRGQRELERAAFSGRRELLAGERSRERWAEALYAETAPHELRNEPRFRRVLAGLRPELQPFPGRASVPAASGYPPGRRPPRKPGGHAGRAQRSRLTCTLGAASQQPALEDPAPGHARTCA